MTEVEEKNGALIVTTTEPRLDAANAPAFRTSVAKPLEHQPKAVILDLERVNFSDSTGLGALVSMLKMMAPDGVLAVAGAQPAVQRLFQITRMDSVFRLFDNRRDAEAAVLA